IKIDREERRLGLSIKAANYSADQLAAETASYEALNRSATNDMMNLGDILDEASKKGEEQARRNPQRRRAAPVLRRLRLVDILTALNGRFFAPSRDKLADDRHALALAGL